MNTRPRAIGIAAAMLCVAHAGTAAPARPAAGEAAGRCEAAVAETVKQTRGTQAQEVQFIGAKRALLAMPDDETGVKGEGRYRRPGGVFVTFTYSCTVGVGTMPISTTRQPTPRRPAATTWATIAPVGRLSRPSTTVPPRAIERPYAAANPSS